MRSLIGGLAPFFSHKLYSRLDVGWAFSLLAFIALAFAPVPWIFYQFGEKWPGKERYGAQVEEKERNSAANGTGRLDVTLEAEGRGFAGA
jgi:hypothetical protein